MKLIGESSPSVLFHTDLQRGGHPRNSIIQKIYYNFKYYNNFLLFILFYHPLDTGVSS